MGSSPLMINFLICIELSYHWEQSNEFINFRTKTMQRYDYIHLFHFDYQLKEACPFDPYFWDECLERAGCIGGVIE